MRYWAIVGIVLCFFKGTISFGQETNWNGFTDINYVIQDSSSFFLGQYDNFINTQITDNISFLSEITFEIEHGDDLEVDIERVILRYQVDNYLNFSVGRHHTPVGLWNTYYHHGVVLQPTITRPQIFNFTGILPIHVLGFYLNGDFIGKKKLGYDLMIGNGGISNSIIGDDFKGKSVTMGAHFYPVNRMKLRLSCHFDKIQEGEDNDNGLALEDIKQHIYTASLDYEASKFRLLAELVALTNKSKSSGKGHTLGLYIYSGFTVGKITPYVRWDEISYDANDPFFTLEDLSGFLGGVRYEFSYNTNVKLEFHHKDFNSMRKTNLLMIQWGVGF